MAPSVADALVCVGCGVSAQRASCIARELARVGFESVDDLGCADEWWLDVDTSIFELHEVGAVCAVVRAVTDGDFVKPVNRKRSEPPSAVDAELIETISRKPRCSAPSCGPAARARALASELASGQEAAQWAEDARISALLGSVQGSISSVKSGLRCWFAFHKYTLKLDGPPLPPRVEHLVAWSTCFRTRGNFKLRFVHASWL